MTTETEQTATKAERMLKRIIREGERDVVTLRRTFSATDQTPEDVIETEVEIKKVERLIALGYQALRSLNNLRDDPAARLYFLQSAFATLSSAADED